MYYQIKTKHETVNPKEKTVSITEEFLVENCELHGEAEAKGYAYGAEYSFDAFDVTNVKRSNIREFINNGTQGEVIFIATIVDIFTNDDGTTKELKYYVGVFSDNIDEATRKVKEYMQQGLNDMELREIKQTKIVGILK